MTLAEFALAGLAALGAGFINALSGGGTLLSFPALTALGLPPVAANITNTIALCPGYLGAVAAQREDLRGQGPRLPLLLSAGALGGVAGGLLLLFTGDRAFQALVPFLILAACVLLLLQDPLRAWLAKRAAGNVPRSSSVQRAAAPIALAAVYGGYFGAGLSSMVLAVLGLLIDDTLTRLNALKQLIALVVNFAAVVLFLFSGRVMWPAALIMMVGALLGGMLGGRLATSIRPQTLRFAVVGLGVAVAVVYLAR
jgi:uncharacterized membrane protein YfcA